MGLCLGFSFLSMVEVGYWFLIRLGILKLKRKKMVTKCKKGRSSLNVSSE